MIAKLKKMLRLEWMLFKLSAIADLQVPMNLGIQFFNDILWYLVQIVLFETLYLNVDHLGGWGVTEMRVFLGMLFLVDAIHMVLFAHNFDVFSEKIAQRDLDLLLLRPVNAKLLMTTQKMQCGFILNVFFATGWLFWSLSMVPEGFSLNHLFLLFFVVPTGLVIFYATRLVVCTMALLLTRAEHFHELFFTFFKVGQRPDHLYGPALRYFILLIVPVGLIASAPTKILMGQNEGWTLPALLLAAAAFFYISDYFWRWSVKRYMTFG